MQRITLTTMIVGLALVPMPALPQSSHIHDTAYFIARRVCDLVNSGSRNNDAIRLAFQEAQLVYDEAISINGDYLPLIYPQYRDAICGEKFKPIRFVGAIKKAGKDKEQRDCPPLPSGSAEKILRGEVVRISTAKCQVRFN